MNPKIAIIGAGIIGITSACKILESFPNANITIIAGRFSPNTTSDVAAGLWGPYHIIDETNDQSKLVLKWSKETYDMMMKVAMSENANKCGIQSMNIMVIQDQKNLKMPNWLNMVSHVKPLSIDEVNIVVSNADKKYRGGYQFLTTTCAVNRYLLYLMNDLKKKGIDFVQKKLITLFNFIEEEGHKYDYIINCTGLGARNFVPDSNMFPTKGQLLRVKAPWIKGCFRLQSDEMILVVPLNDLVVVGGSQEENVYDFNTDMCDQILTKCNKRFPNFKDAEVVTKQAGHRPSRKGGVRLELEVISNVKVIHNYGHDGLGVTLCWGCAADVVELINQDITPKYRLSIDVIIDKF